jgi:hypothetical protein
MTDGPPDTDCVTLLVRSTVPRVQLVLVTVPAFESTVVVPVALQFHAGAVLKFVAHWVASTFTEGGSETFEQVTHAPAMQWALDAHAWPPPHPPQLALSVWKLTHPPLHDV